MTYRRTVEEAWTRYTGGAEVAPGVRGEIGASWQRVRDRHRVDPTMKSPLRFLTPEALDERRRRDAVLARARPLLQELAACMPGHVAALVDAEGWMLELAGAPALADALREIHFEPGACWAEGAAGTNAPGTALAAASPLEVRSVEHWVEAWHRVSCSAAPIFGPEPGAPPVGAIDLTSPWERHAPGALALVRMAAVALGERLRAAAETRAEVVRHALREARAGTDALLAVDASGRVLAANDAAGRRGLPGGALEACLEAALKAALGGAGEEVRLFGPDGQPVVASVIRHAGEAAGALVRVPAPRLARDRRQREGPCARYEFAGILGESPALRRVLALAQVAAGNDLPIVLQGESGTGKELFAHAIHHAGSRSGGPFVVVNCGAIPAELVEAELFGYEPGAFTGAKKGGSAGRFEDAGGGTVFLDEVSELPLAAQAALLRLLQEREVVRLGASAPRPVDVRVVAATNKPLEAEARAGRFRRDLYYRLCVLRVDLPPLRERGRDVALLARTFLAQAEADVGRPGLSFAPDALEALGQHGWPGNVRELRNVVLRAAATAPGVVLRAADLQFDGAIELAPAAPGGHGPSGSLRSAVARSERERVLEAVQACGWNLSHAAQELGVARPTLYRLLHRLGIARPGAARAPDPRGRDM